MRKIKKFADCFKVVPEVERAKKWAGICTIVAAIILGLVSFLGVLIGIAIEEGGFLVFLIFMAVGFMSASSFWILGAALSVMASSAQSNAEIDAMIQYKLEKEDPQDTAKPLSIQTASSNELPDELPLKQGMVRKIEQEKTGKCEICGHEEQVVCRYEINDHLGKRYRYMCQKCVEEYSK